MSMSNRKIFFIATIREEKVNETSDIEKHLRAARTIRITEVLPIAGIITGITTDLALLEPFKKLGIESIEEDRHPHV